jgi:hypothetical protein
MMQKASVLGLNDHSCGSITRQCNRRCCFVVNLLTRSSFLALKSGPGYTKPTNESFGWLLGNAHTISPLFLAVCHFYRLSLPLMAYKRSIFRRS